jgi:hypothetical protein
MKLAVFCIDGMEPSIVLNKPDMFPFFRDLIEQGLYAELLDTELCGSLGKWISFLTGVSFNHHGVEEGARSFYFPKLENIRKFEQQYIWNVLNRNGFSVGLANFYGMYPAPELNGFSWCEPQCLVSGMGSGFNEEAMIYPRNLCADFQILSHPEVNEPRSLKQLGVQESWAELKQNPRPLEKVFGEDYYKEFTDTIGKRVEWTLERLTKYCDTFSPDVLLYYNWDIDKAQHFSWHESSLKNILASYKHIERLIQSTCDRYHPETVLIFSDHGHGSFKNLIQYDYKGLNPVMRRIYEKHYEMADYLTLADGTKVMIGQNGGLVSGTHAIKGILLASGKGIPAKGAMPLLPFRYLYTGVLRLLGIEKGKFYDWWKAPSDKNWYEPEPDSIPGMFSRLKVMEKDHFERYERQEIDLLEKICKADEDRQFLKFTIPCATRIGTHYFDEGLHDLARKWHEDALSLDLQNLYPRYTMLNQMHLAFLDQEAGNIKKAAERYIAVAKYCGMADDGMNIEKIPSLKTQLDTLEKLVEERTRWAGNLEQEIVTRDTFIVNLQAEFESKVQWITALEQKVAERDALILKLQSALDAKKGTSGKNISENKK